jgi:protein-S-isoprenylcysteine O-methyltransferase Ste14
MVRTIIILPGMVVIFIPAAILWVTAGTTFPGEVLKSGRIVFWLSLVPAVFGLLFAVWTVLLFMKFGKGTPAPWDPPKKLVVRGPYLHVRNPMITSVLLMLITESLVFQSWYLAVWTLVFFVLNLLYFPLVEEKGLERRFGEDYRAYKANVPRWVPRLRPWSG